MSDDETRLPTSYWTDAIRADLKRRRDEAEAADPLDQATRNRRAGDLAAIRAEIRPTVSFQPETAQEGK